MGSLDNSLPPDAKSFSVKIQPSNLSTVVGSISTGTTSNVILNDIAFPTQNIQFDLFCGSSPSLFLDNRFTTISFNVTVECTDGGTGIGGTGTAIQSWGESGAFQRSGGHSWFDSMTIVGQSGNQIEQINEFGLVNDTLIALQMNDRKGVATQYGFDVPDNQNISLLGNQGHKYQSMHLTNASATGTKETHSYSFPLIGCIGVTSDKFINLGRTSKMQCLLSTAKLLPITVPIGDNNITTPAIYKVTLSNFCLQLEYIDIGVNALQLLDQTLQGTEGISYIHGVTYRTSTAVLSAGSVGEVSLLAGIRASSVKSLFTRFGQNGTASTTNSCNGKYDSVCPLLSGINYSICGIKYPQYSVNPLLSPAQSYRETQMAVGSFNNCMFQSSIIPSQYCKLSAGGTAQSLYTGGSQSYEWNLGTNPYSCAQYIFGVCLETVARRGLMSGTNTTSVPVFVDLRLALPITNSHVCYIIAMCDQIICHDVQSGEITMRI
jgi:hypothetical protein